MSTTLSMSPTGIPAISLLEIAWIIEKFGNPSPETEA